MSTIPGLCQTDADPSCDSPEGGAWRPGRGPSLWAELLLGDTTPTHGLPRPRPPHSPSTGHYAVTLHILLPALGAQGGLDKAQHPVLEALRGSALATPFLADTCRSAPHFLPHQRGVSVQPPGPHLAALHRLARPRPRPRGGLVLHLPRAGVGGATLLNETVVLTRRQVPSIVMGPTDAHGGATSPPPGPPHPRRTPWPSRRPPWPRPQGAVPAL